VDMMGKAIARRLWVGFGVPILLYWRLLHIIYIIYIFMLEIYLEALIF
jgi:hypothetical protein